VVQEVGDEDFESEGISKNREDVQEIDTLSMTDSNFRPTLGKGKERRIPSWGNLGGLPGGS